VALVPTALPDDGPLLGPVHVTLRARTVTMAYAFGRPADGSMGMTTHALELTPNGALVPRTVATGSVGLAAGVRSLPFSAPRPGAPPAPRTWLPTLFLRLLHCGVGTPQH
jgi:hypothetical protein